MQLYKLNQAHAERRSKPYSHACRQYNYCVRLSPNTIGYKLFICAITPSDKLRFKMEFPKGFAKFNPHTQ